MVAILFSIVMEREPVSAIIIVFECKDRKS